VTAREERAARWPTGVYLNLYQLSALLAELERDRRSPRGLLTGQPRDGDLRAAVRKLSQAADRRRRAVERARSPR
jgi:hypothetical protein